MVRVLAIAAAPVRFAPVEGLRAAFVCGCALALIFAGRPLPF